MISWEANMIVARSSEGVSGRSIAVRQNVVGVTNRPPQVRYILEMPSRSSDYSMPYLTQWHCERPCTSSQLCTDVVIS